MSILTSLTLPLAALDDLLEHRGELLAWPAPFGPEIHQHRLALGFLDHVLHERLGGRVLDGDRWCAAASPLCNIVIVFLSSSVQARTVDQPQQASAKPSCA